MKHKTAACYHETTLTKPLPEIIQTASPCSGASSRTSPQKRWPTMLAMTGILLLANAASAFEATGPQFNPRAPTQNYLETSGPIPIIGDNDLIGWSADGNKVDPDDIAASPMAMAILAKRGWQNKLVHFSYNNNPMPSSGAQPNAMRDSVEGAHNHFGYTDTTKLYNCQVDSEWNAAVNDAVNIIKNTAAGQKFYWVQAGPHELAYQALKRVKDEAPGKLSNVVMVSHSGVNNVSSHPVRPGVRVDGDKGRTLADCLNLSNNIGYFYTSVQGGKDNFGNKGHRDDSYNNWDAVRWMETSDCEAWKFLHSQFRKMTEIEGGKKDALDASDGGMAFVLAALDAYGNFTTLGEWIGGWCPSQ